MRLQHPNSRFGIAGRYVTVLAACLLAAGCRHDPQPASVLLFNGSGTSPGDVAAVENILRETHVSYTTANSRQLAALTPAQLAAYRLLIVPGGNFVEIGSSLTRVAVANIRNAVQGVFSASGLAARAYAATLIAAALNATPLPHY